MLMHGCGRVDGQSQAVTYTDTTPTDTLGRTLYLYCADSVVKDPVGMRLGFTRIREWSGKSVVMGP